MRKPSKGAAWGGVLREDGGQEKICKKLMRKGTWLSDTWGPSGMAHARGFQWESDVKAYGDPHE